MTIVEIGPGGAPTRPLLAAVEHLHATKSTATLPPNSREFAPPDVHTADAGSTAARAPCASATCPTTYRHSAVPTRPVWRADRDIHVMLQKEIVARMVAIRQRLRHCPDAAVRPTGKGSMCRRRRSIPESSRRWCADARCGRRVTAHDYAWFARIVKTASGARRCATSSGFWRNRTGARRDCADGARRSYRSRNSSRLPTMSADAAQADYPAFFWTNSIL